MSTTDKGPAFSRDRWARVMRLVDGRRGFRWTPPQRRSFKPSASAARVDTPQASQ